MAPITTRPAPSSAPAPGTPAVDVGPLDRAISPLLRTQARPVSAAADQAVTLPPDLGALFPGGTARRGTVVHIAPASPDTSGVTSLAMALLAAVMATGGWGAIVGFPDTGVAAIADAGVDLDRLVFVPEPGARWAEVTAIALAGMTVVLTRPPAHVPPRIGRRLAAVARDQRSVLVVAGLQRWPEPPDVRLVVRSATWIGLGDGHGHLSARHCTVVAEGRRAAARPVETTLWLPGRGSHPVPDDEDGPARAR
ncbi:MAG: hypothetical protein M0013_08790 [Actinomycetota bacterium]|nr:hypothetical protein [Actinomycetota bacterium]